MVPIAPSKMRMRWARRSRRAFSVDEIMRDEIQVVYGKRRRRKRKNDLKRGSQHLEMRWAPLVEDSPKTKWEKPCDFSHLGC